MIRGQDKIAASHRDRQAYVYIRQSSPSQVLKNLESQERQYELQDLVKSLGWPPESIQILDEDLGHSANGLKGRDGFTKLRGEVCEGRVGLVMTIETARLARNNREWYQLLDICAVCGTLVAEPTGVYDPRDYEDRLHLGLKGILSEAELHIMKSRLVAGAHHKAEKGELYMKLPVGLVADPDGKAVLDPDQGVQQSMRSLFEKFSELGSVRKVFRWMLENSIKMPRREGKGLFSKVVWRAPTYPALQYVFQNPRYAGAYVFGRSERYLRVENGEPRCYSRKVPPEKWRVVIQGAHPGYLTWEEFMKNRDRIRQNYLGTGKGRGAPGRGAALLQGLIRCGRCANRVQVRYQVRTSGVREAAYACYRGNAQFLTGPCQRVGVLLVDHLVEEAFLRVLEPAPLEISLDALQRLEENGRAAERHWQLRLERARYEAERARRQYDQVEPENRLVARDLERHLEERLREVKRIDEEYASWKKGREVSWNAAQTDELRELVKDVRKLWSAESTTNEDRKELLRLLIEDIWLFTNRDKREIEVKILWKGGSQTIHRAVWWLNGRGVKEEVVGCVRELAAKGVLDIEIAKRLNAEGHRRCDGLPFMPHNVTQIRRNHGIEKVPPPREPDVYNAKEAAKKIGVCSETIKLWIRDGILEGRWDRSTWEWKVKLPPEEESRVLDQWDRGKEWPVAQVAKYLKLHPWEVYKLIYGGILHAREAKIGRRDRLLISEEEARRFKDASRSANNSRSIYNGGAG
jgi:DNA invertase Pin-like site-specific DNA recombinase